MKTRNKLALAASVFAVAAPLSLAHAQATDTDPARPKLLTKYGMSASVGAGVLGFTDGDMTDFADVGGSWEARVAFGTRQQVAVEAAYVGGAAAIDALGLDSDAVLLSSGLEGNVRVNVFARGQWQPYFVAGVAWRRYDIVNANQNTSSVNGDDNVMEIPLGAGVSWRYKGLLVDARAVFRPAVDNDLVRVDAGEPEVDLHTWEASLRGGWEF